MRVDAVRAASEPLLLASIRAHEPLSIEFLAVEEGCLRSTGGGERCFDLVSVRPSVFTFFLGFVLSWSEDRARLVAIGLKKKEGSNSASSEPRSIDRDGLGVSFLAAFGVVLASLTSESSCLEFAAKLLVGFDGRLVILNR